MHCGLGAVAFYCYSVYINVFAGQSSFGPLKKPSRTLSTTLFRSEIQCKQLQWVCCSGIMSRSLRYVDLVFQRLSGVRVQLSAYLPKHRRETDRFVFNLSLNHIRDMSHDLTASYSMFRCIMFETCLICSYPYSLGHRLRSLLLTHSIS